MSDRAVALVTGAGRRVGREIAAVLARAGCDLVVTYRDSKDEIESAAREWEAAGASVRVDRLELGDLDAVERLANEWARDLPRLDILVHNASMYRPDDETPRASALAHFQINALAPLILSRGLADRLRASSSPGGGAIVAMADVHALGRPRRGMIGYAMSKAALVEMVQTLAIELAPRVRVNAVAPGVVAFPSSGPESEPAMQARYLSRVPLGRSGTPNDAAEAVRWLALDAHYTTGQILRVDGGRWLG